MKKIILYISLILIFIAYNIRFANAEVIKWHAPFSQTGTYQALVKLVADGLAEKGWQLDVKVTGNPKLGRDVFDESKETFLLAWGTETHSSKSDPHYLKPPSVNSLIGFVHFAPVYLCTNKDISHDNFINKKYKIGAVGDRPTLKYLKNWMEVMKNNHQVITYRGSGDLEIGLASGEIDLAFTSRGANMHETGKARCLYNSGTKDVVNIPTVKSKFVNFDDGVYGFGMYIIAKNISKQKLEKLQKDLIAVKKNYVPLIEHMEKMRFQRVLDDLPIQVEFLQKIDNSLE